MTESFSVNTHLGELTGTLTELSKLHGMRRDTVYNRVHKGMSLEKALSTSTVKQYTVKAEGVEHSGSMSELCEEFSISKSIIKNRLRQGKTLTEAFTQPLQKEYTIETPGKTVTGTIARLSAEFGINKHTVWHRMNRGGMGLEEALLTPLKRFPPHSSIWTISFCKLAAKNYSTVDEWKESHPASYYGAKAYGWVGMCSEHMDKIYSWTEDEVLVSASKFRSVSEWKRSESGAYEASGRLGIREICISKMLDNHSFNSIDEIISHLGDCTGKNKLYIAESYTVADLVKDLNNLI